MDLLIANASKIMALVGILAFLVSIIIEVIKNVGFLKNIPTQLITIVVSILICTVGYIAYTSYIQMPITWYYVFAAFISSFVVSYVAMYGFDTLNELYQRFKK